MPDFSTQPRLILASTSPYRAELLSRLKIPFAQEASGVDETQIPGEAPAARAERLALEKAQAVSRRRPDHWVVGSDQVAHSQGLILHKPGSAAANLALLRRLSGRQVEFCTAVALVRAGQGAAALDITVVTFRPLDDQTLERYVTAEPAWDCAGGFKAEGLGISLFEEILSRDPTGLIGLPLIGLSKLLRNAGLL